MPWTQSPSSNVTLDGRLPGISLRVIEIDGDPWFVASDICDALTLPTVNVRRSLDEDEVKSIKLMGMRGKPPLLVAESGLYSLVMRSNKPEARAFRKWVTSVVLPAIRRDGAYGLELSATVEVLYGIFDGRLSCRL